jgi:AraC-like DNA-binding protein
MIAALREYAEYLPAPELRPWVLAYWRFSTGDLPADVKTHTVWPDGCTSVVLAVQPSPGPRVFLTGPRITAHHPPARANSVLWGVRLWPDATREVLGEPARALRDWIGPAPPSVSSWALPLLTDAEREVARDARAGVAVAGALDAQLAARVAGWQAPDRSVRIAVTHIAAHKGRATLTDAAREAMLSLRQLQRRFSLACGLTMREWARIRRFRESLALRLATESRWSEIAAESGFADHAHLTREYRLLVGRPPTDVAEHLGSIAHSDVRP